MDVSKQQHTTLIGTITSLTKWQCFESHQNTSSRYNTVYARP